MISSVVLFIYLIVSCYFLRNWLCFFKSKLTLSPEDCFFSLVILILVIVFWPFAVVIYLYKALRGLHGKGIVINQHRGVPAGSPANWLSESYCDPAILKTANLETFSKR